jgi:hypothetical protein
MTDNLRFVLSGIRRDEDSIFSSGQVKDFVIICRLRSIMTNVRGNLPQVFCYARRERIVDQEFHQIQDPDQRRLFRLPVMSVIPHLSRTGMEATP